MKTLSKIIISILLFSNISAFTFAYDLTDNDWVLLSKYMSLIVVKMGNRPVEDWKSIADAIQKKADKQPVDSRKYMLLSTLSQRMLSYSSRTAFEKEIEAKKKQLQELIEYRKKNMKTLSREEWNKTGDVMGKLQKVIADMEEMEKNY